ncbi:MAG: type II toxin-antitoxin system HicB family antitoxin [Myxococcota bacterium]|jgi:antitoxin HicB
MQIPDGYYAILIRKGPNEIWVKFPEHSNIITWGETWEEAEKSAWEALNGCLESDLTRGFVLPAAHKVKAARGERVVFVPLQPEVRTAYLLRAWREAAHMTQAAVAERAGMPLPSYQRMEKPGRANLTVKSLEKVAAALGKRLVLELA